jgi:NAD(P)-dependent dehydrogenase (short-subunit alcohol dehydrogenase family)
MINMSMGLSKALSSTGVTVNTVTPGMIMTDGLMDFLRTFAAKRGWGADTDRAADYILKGCGQTVDRIGQPEDIAYAVAMLASPRGGFLNGVNVHMDGGGTGSIY